MRSEGVSNTAILFIAGACCIYKSIEHGIKCIQTESSTTILKISAILFPLAVIIAKITEKIFDSLNWQSSELRDMTLYAFTLIVSTELVAALASHFQWTQSSLTTRIISLIAAQSILGVCYIRAGVQNINLGTNHRLPDQFRVY